MPASTAPVEAVNRPSSAPSGPESQAAARPAAQFSTYLNQALSSFTRKSTQTAFLLMPTATVSEAGDADADAQRLLVLRNAAAGYVPPAPDDDGEPLPVTVRTAATQSRPEVTAPTTATTAVDISPLAMSDFPRPAGDNGMGIHWVPTLQSSPEVVDTFVEQAADMGMKWVVFLNDGTNVGDNDYLVKRLVEKGIMPVLRVFTNGLEPVSGDLQAMVSHYRSLGVSYFQLYNEPNLMVETHGQTPDVDEYLDLWIPAAKQVIAAGGLPGIGALSPQGEVDDRQYLAETLQGLKARGEEGLLDRSWLSVHNYTGPRDLSDPDGFLRFRQYDAIVRSELGRSLPMVGCEGGTQIGPGVDEQKQADMMLSAWDYMQTQSEPYMFAYTYWIIANEAGGGRDPAFSQHALIGQDGPTALAQALFSKA
ncbi:MAG: hypothetical protein ACYC5O_15200 [Anaerolineae bacterium]